MTGTEEAGKPLGTAHGDLLECEGEILKVKSKCNSLGDTAGTILLLGAGHLVFDKLGVGAELKTAILSLITTAIHIECASGTALILLTGMTLCLHLIPTVKSKEHEGHCVQTAGHPEDKLYFNAAGEMVSISPLLSSLNGSTAEEAAELGLGRALTTEEVVADQ